MSVPEVAAAPQREVVAAPTTAPPAAGGGDLLGLLGALGNQSVTARVARCETPTAARRGGLSRSAGEDHAIQLALAGTRRIQRCGDGECTCGGACGGHDQAKRPSPTDDEIEVALASRGPRRVQRCEGGECHCGGACGGAQHEDSNEQQKELDGKTGREPDGHEGRVRRAPASRLRPAPVPSQIARIQRISEAYEQEHRRGTHPELAMGRVLARFPGDGMAPPGDCSWAKYGVLRLSVESAKAIVSTLGACAPGDSCIFLATKIAAITAEIAARVALDTSCFKGGDTGHRQQVQDKINMVNRCFRFFQNSDCDPRLITAMAVVVEQARRVVEAAALAVAAAVVVAAVVALVVAIIALVEAIAAAIAAAAAAVAEAAVITAALAGLTALLVLIRDGLSAPDEA